MNETELVTPGGITLRQHVPGSGLFSCRMGLVRFTIERVDELDRWEASATFGAVMRSNLAECLAWLDVRRADGLRGLMPTDARDRIIAVLDRGHLAAIPSDKWDHTHDAAMHEIEKDADAVLAALGVGKDE